MRRLALALALCLSCHGGSSAYSDAAARCQAPRSGTDAFTGKAFPDQKGSLNDEKTWLKGFMSDLYLWYREIPSVDASKYTAMDAYFQALKTPQKTATGKLKDAFSFTLGTAEWEALSQSGVEAGYGATFALVSRSPPRKAVVAYTEPNTPATSAPASLTRGVEILNVDGAAVVDGNKDVLNAGLFPTDTNPHTFTVLDHGTQRTFSMTPASILSVPVKNVGFLPNNPGVGYILFNAHIGTAEKGLVDAITQLKGATDLVLDMRYNGGGYLVLASELAYMIAGPGKTAGAYFEKTVFNDKYTANDPVTGRTLAPTPFYTQTVGLSETAGQALPHLDLNRVFILTGSGTCSASESVINGLIGAGVTVNLFGKNTCGKPYGFYPQDNCGTTYFAIEFQGLNAQGFGDYADGFVPGGGGPAGPPGCLVNDDFTHDLGDPAEARLAAALQFRSGGACPPAPASRAETAAAGPAGDEDVTLVRNPVLEMRWMVR